MIDDNDTSSDDNVLRGAFDSAKAIDGTPINEPADEDFSHPAKTKTITKKLKQGEVEMADVDTNMLAQQHSDIRREAAEHTNEIVKEGLKGDYSTQKAITDGLSQTSNQIDAFEDVANAAFMTVARDTADLRAQLVQAIDTVKLATELNALKSIIEGQKNTTYLSDKITDDGEKTRGLINDLKYHDLNRSLVERNTELVEAAAEGRHWRYAADQSQWASLQSQIQAFQSQLQETRQGMVNFGTMAGVGQTSTSNNVR